MPCLIGTQHAEGFAPVESLVDVFQLVHGFDLGAFDRVKRAMHQSAGCLDDGRDAALHVGRIAAERNAVVRQGSMHHGARRRTLIVDVTDGQIRAIGKVEKFVRRKVQSHRW